MTLKVMELIYIPGAKLFGRSICNPQEIEKLKAMSVPI